MAEDREVTLDEQIQCVERELAMRRRVYPRWVNSPRPKLTREAADREIARMEAVRLTLVRLRADQQAQVSR